MTLYLCHESALKLIRYLRSTGGGRLDSTPMRRKNLRDSVNSVRGLNELDETASRWLEHVSRPIHAFVDKPQRQTKTNVLVTHVWSSVVPNGTFVNLGHGVCVSSAAALLLQLATSMDTAELASIAMELCGGYSRWHLPLGGMGDPLHVDYEENRSCTFGLTRLTNKARIDTYLARNPGARGAVKARAALRWVLDDSMSPMETAIYLQLCLPRRLGGYGLPQPVLNPKVTVSNPDGSKTLFPDLFWRGPNIDVEYNSDYAHSGDWKRHKDSKREVELVVGDVTVLPLTRPQVMDESEFDAFANGLRKLLGIRSRKGDEEWAAKRTALRKAVLPIG